MSEINKEFVGCVLSILDRKGVPTSKVLLHKFIYFMSTQGVNTGFRFEPYTYGPYSFDLASTLGSMVFWDEILDDGKTVKIQNISCFIEHKEELLAKVNKHFDEFLSIVSDNFSFKNLECIGTALYCADVLSCHGEKPTEEAVVTEFKSWKGNKYPDETIRSAFTRILPFIRKNSVRFNSREGSVFG